MPEIIIIDGLEYTKSNHRLRYTPEFHENHNKPFTTKDLIYMCSMWDSTKKAELAMALGRTLSAIYNKKCDLNRSGKFDYYKKLGEKEK